jgi:hypothetical protein
MRKYFCSCFIAITKFWRTKALWEEKILITLDERLNNTLDLVEHQMGFQGFNSVMRIVRNNQGPQNFTLGESVLVQWHVQWWPYAYDLLQHNMQCVSKSEQGTATMCGLVVVIVRLSGNETVNSNLQKFSRFYAHFSAQEQKPPCAPHQDEWGLRNIHMWTVVQAVPSNSWDKW